MDHVKPLLWIIQIWDLSATFMVEVGGRIIRDVVFHKDKLLVELSEVVFIIACIVAIELVCVWV